jgi:hypothetical protein
MIWLSQPNLLLILGARHPLSFSGTGGGRIYGRWPAHEVLNGIKV